MHVLFVHQNYPAQFGHIAKYLVADHGFRCTFVSRKPARIDEGIELVQYEPKGGATARNHFCTRTFENIVWHSHAVHDALAQRPDIRPDLIVGHTGFASTLYLRELYDCPIINYFEYFYRTLGSDMDFRPEFVGPPIDRLRARTRNAMILLDLENCDAGYSPTLWQRSRLPETFHDKVDVIFDGVDTKRWRPLPDTPRRLGQHVVPKRTRIVTYVARGFESMRGFDVFMKAANRICRRRKDVIFVVVGADRVCYGGDQRFTDGKSFKQWVLDQDDYDLSRFVFTGMIPAADLARLFSISDLHLYLTVPFILSWSMMNALACGATVLASDTGPVREMIEHGHNGLLADFHDVDGLADRACEVLDAPADYRCLGVESRRMIDEKYSLDVCLPRLLDLYGRANSRHDELVLAENG